jgi:hypothetical protein
MGIGRRSEKDGFKIGNGVKLIREGAREMGMREAHNRICRYFQRIKASLHCLAYGFCLKFQIWFLLIYPYMAFVGNLRSGFC